MSNELPLPNEQAHIFENSLTSFFLTKNWESPFWGNRDSQEKGREREGESKCGRGNGEGQWIRFSKGPLPPSNLVEIRKKMFGKLYAAHHHPCQFISYLWNFFFHILNNCRKERFFLNKRLTFKIDCTSFYTKYFFYLVIEKKLSLHMKLP